MLPRLSLVCGLALLALWPCAAVGLAPAPDAAPGKHDDHGHGGPQVHKVHLHLMENGKHVEKEVKFDLSKEADRQAYFGHLTRGEVHEAKVDQPVNLLALKADLGIWSIVVFLVLFFILSRYAWPQILAGLQSREASIQGAIDEAQKTRDEAKKMQDDLAKQLAAANDTVRGILDEARRDAARTTEDMIAKARTEIQADRDRMKRELESAKDAALKELWDNSVKLASLISTKAIKRSLDAETHQRLFDEALAELSVQEKLLKG